MPSTRELVSIIKEDYAPDWALMKILQFLDRAQRSLMMNDCAQTVWLDEADEQFPFAFLKTQEGVLSYDIKASNFRAFDDNHTVEFTKNGYDVKMRRIRHVFIMGNSLG